MNEAALDVPVRRRVAGIEWSVMVVVAGAMLTATLLDAWSLSIVEVLGFITGGVCVWLCVREHPWNWPIGLANNGLFVVLFWRSRLFADMGLQFVYAGLAIYGWWQWKFGGAQRSELTISRIRRPELVAAAVLITAGTYALMRLLIAAQGAAPWADALTTTISLAAQYLMCRKRLENWWFWIAADVIYVPLYASRGLPLTAVLYAIFLVMCLVGLRNWTRSSAEPIQTEERPHGV
jgi:nicotinamide mononucleotide transporter